MQPRRLTSRVNSKRILKAALASAFYFATFLLLARASALFERGPGVEPWNPAAGVSLTFLLLFGPAWAPLVFVANLISLMGRWSELMALPLVGAALLPALAYAFVAWGMRRAQDPPLEQPSAGRVFRWLLLMTAATAGLGAATAGLISSAGLASSSWRELALTSWLGELVGVTTMLPLLLAGALAWRSSEAPFAELKRYLDAWLRATPWSAPLMLLEAAGLMITLLVVFGLRQPGDPTLLYPLFLPLLWLTVRYGFRGAALASFALAAGSMFWLGRMGLADLDLLELQAFLLSLSVAGLLLGAALAGERRAHGELQEQEMQYQVVERRREVAEAMREVVAMINSEASLEQVLAVVAEQASALLDADAMALFLLDTEQQVLTIAASSGMPQEFKESLRLPIGSGAVGQAVLTRQPQLVNDLQAMVAEDEARWGTLAEEDRTSWFLERFETILSVPLLARERVLGGISLYYTQPRQIQAQEVALAVSFADQAALALENARLHTQSQELAVLQERQRIARELHDSVSQALYGISLGARTARTLWQRDQQGLDEPLEYIQTQADAGLAEMRSLIFELRPESLEAEGLAAVLERLGQAVAARHDLHLVADMEAEPRAPMEVKEAFYRIAQEALNNVQKHAQAQRIELKLHQQQGRLTLVVADDGAGFDPRGVFPGHFGLQSMRERAERAGADLVLQSEKGAGTRLEVHWLDPSVSR